MTFFYPAFRATNMRLKLLQQALMQRNSGLDPLSQQRNFIQSLGPVAWYRMGSGITQGTSGIAQWNNVLATDNSLVLPAVAGNSASAPDSVPLSITGDLCLIIKLNEADWSPAAQHTFIAKWNNTGNQRSFGMNLETTGLISSSWSTDGTALGQASASSTVSTGFSNNTTHWLALTIDVDNGAGGNTSTFYTSEDGVTFNQLGTPVINAGTTSIFDSTALLEIGRYNSGTGNPSAMQIYRAIVKSGGLTGTTVFDANFEAQTPGTLSFIESSSNAATVTINQSGNPPAHIGHPTDLLQVTDASRPPYLEYLGTKYLWLPGVAGNYASTPDSAANSITGDIDIRVKLSMADWTPAAGMFIVNKLSSVGQYSYDLTHLGAAGTIRFRSSSDGANLVIATSTVATGITDGAIKWIRATLDIDNGAGGNTVTFYLSDDGITWAQLGDPVVTAGVTSIFNGTDRLCVGQDDVVNAPLSGKVYRAIIKNGINGTTAVDFNPNADATDSAATFVSSATGETWTVNSTAPLRAQIVGRTSILFDGVADFLKTAAFTLNQPTTVVIGGLKQVSWTNVEAVFDGNAQNSGALFQSATTPRILLHAGSNTTENANLAVGAYGVVAAQINGASSFTRVNNTANVTGNAGAANMGGFTLGAIGTGISAWSNIQVSGDIIILPSAPDAATLSRVISYLNQSAALGVL